jgi:hypothetical protein
MFEPPVGTEVERMWYSFTPAQALNALFPMLVTPLGIVRDASAGEN